MIIPLWIISGVIVGLAGYFIDPDRNIHTLIGGIMLGVIGSLQGMLVSTILSTIPITTDIPSPLLFSFSGGILLLMLGKLTKKAF